MNLVSKSGVTQIKDVEATILRRFWKCSQIAGNILKHVKNINSQIW